MLNSQSPFPFLLERRIYYFVWESRLAKRLQVQLDGRKNEPPKESVLGYMGARAHTHALHVLRESHSWKKAGCDAAQGIPL